MLQVFVKATSSVPVSLSWGETTYPPPALAFRAVCAYGREPESGACPKQRPSVPERAESKKATRGALRETRGVASNRDVGEYRWPFLLKSRLLLFHDSPRLFFAFYVKIIFIM